MAKIKTYTAEAEIADLIQEQSSIAYVSQLTKSIPNNNDKDKLLKLLAKHDIAQADVRDDDLYSTHSILVSTNWNKNDDVFGKEHVWPARNTPAHKPTNLNHDEQLIVGHMTDDIYAVDNDGNILANNLNVADLPDIFHIVNGAVIYKCWSDEELQKRTATLIEQIENNEKFVSMECLFTDFDYAVQMPDGKQHVVARDEESAWLTKHLRAYGGDGIYNDYKVGRYLKNITFVGKGYVDKPANPNSIIFDKNSVPFAKSSEENPVLENNGVSIFKERSLTQSSVDPQTKNKEATIMAEDKKVEALEAKIVELQQKLVEADAQKFEAKIEELQADVKARDESLVEINETKDAITTQAEEIQAKLDEKSKAYDELQVKLDEMEKAKIEANRISSLVDGGIEKDAAESKVKLFENLSDEQFDAVAKELIEAKKAYKKTKKEDEEDEKKATDDTSKAEETTEEEVDESEAEATDETLESAEANEDVDITGGSNDTNEIDDLRKDLMNAIAATLGVKQEKETE